MNELVRELGLAIVIVAALIVFTLGWREAIIVVTAVPLTFALTLLVNYLAGYSINRVTLFALILSLGLVVDDPIVDVENIFRHFRLRQEAAAAGRADRGERSPPADHRRHARRDRLVPADVLHHRHDAARTCGRWP